MTHISSIGAGMFSDLSVAMPTAATYDPKALALAGEGSMTGAFKTAILSEGGARGAGTFVRVENVREFPSMGTPPNIVNVPVYGQATSQQIQGQADAPSIELTLNYIATDWADGTLLGDAVGDGNQYLFRFTLLNSEPPSYVSDPADNDTAGDETIGGTAGLAGNEIQVENSQYYWVGKIEALQVNPQLTDSNTATISISIQSDFYGAFTTTAATTT